MGKTLTHEEVLAVPTVAAPSGGTRRLPRHLAEMAAAMVAGMVLLGPLWELAGAALGFAGALHDRPEVAALVMATDMTVGMTVWMRYRRHAWRGVAEMAAAMYVPFLLLFPPFWAGLVDGDAVLMGGHLLMVPAMVLVALRHRHEAPAAIRRHPLVVALARRWPTWLALLLTADNWATQTVPPPLLMVGLPAAYLLIGAFRRTLRGPGVLATQLVGLAGWLALAVTAVALGGRAAAWLVAIGWLAHVGWDVVHHRTGRVVPRAYAELCIVIDTVLGVTVILGLLSTSG